tara:strand:- start:279 stop:6842 length:6564 start_codon:yes stop_codon:yes gene_type:complete
MWELDGILYTEDQIQGWADEEQLSLEEYIAVYGLNKKEEKDDVFGDTEYIEFDSLPEAPEVVVPEIQEPTVQPEPTYQRKIDDTEAEGIWGNVVDFFDDIGRAWTEGYEQGKLTDAGIELLKGNATEEEIEEWVSGNAAIAEKNMGSLEMQEFDRIYEEAGGGWWGFLKGIAYNPSTLSTMLVSSIATQVGSVLTSEEVGGAAAAGAAAGAGIGVWGFGIGAIPGGAIGAMGASMGAMEAGLTFSELLMEEIGGNLNDPGAKEKVKAVLDNPEKLSELRNKAIGRGVTIAGIEIATMGLAKGVGAKLISKGMPATAGLAVGATEVIGGGLGEVGGRLVAGQEMDVKEIGFEAVAGLGSAPVTFGTSLANLSVATDRIKITNELQLAPKKANYKTITDAFKPNKRGGFNVTTTDINITKIKNSAKILDQEVKAKIQTGEITRDQGNQIRKNFREVQGGVQRIKSLNLNPVQEREAIKKLNEINKLDQTIKEVNNKSLSKPDIERKEQLNKELENLKTGFVDVLIEDRKVRLEKDLGFAKKAAKVFNIDFVDNLSTKEITSKYGKEYGRSDGFIKRNKKTGRLEIVINKERAANTNAVTVGSHELLHGILKNSLMNNPEAGRIIQEFRSKLNAEQNAAIDKKAKGLRYFINNTEVTQERYDKSTSKNKTTKRLYSDKDLADSPDEYLAFFSDAIQKGEIVFEENIFTKIGDIITPILRAVGFSKIKFNSGKDVYNFMREYNKSINEGVLSEAILEATTPDGTIIDAVEEEVVPKSQSELIGVNELAQIYKMDPSNKLVERDLISQYESVALSALGYDVKRGTIAPAEALSFVRSQFKSIIDRYKPEISAFTTHVNANIVPKREGFYNKLIGEEVVTTSLDDERAREVADTTPTETTQKVEKKPTTNPLKLFGIDEKAKTNFVEKTVKALKKLNLDNLTYKTLKTLDEQGIADLVGIPAKKIFSPTANLSQPEARKALMFVNKNAQSLINLLPDHNTEVKEVEAKNNPNKKVFIGGLPTGVPRNIQKLFYTKGKRIGNNFQWNKKKDITVESFKKALGIEGNIKSPDFKVRSNTSQALKGMLELVGRAITNTAARQYLKDIGADPLLIENIAEGKNPAMFSESVLDDVRNINVFQEKETKTDKDYAKFGIGKGWSKFYNAVNAKPLNPKDEADREKMRLWIEKVLPKYLPKSIIIALGASLSNGPSAYKSRGFWFEKAQDTGELIQNVVQFAKLSDKQEKDILAAFKKQGYYDKSKKRITPKFLSELWGTKKLKDQNAAKLRGLKEIFLIFEKMMKDDKANAQFIIGILSKTSGHQSHFVRTAAPIKFLTFVKGKPVVEEHTLPASLTAKYLFQQAVDGTVNKNYKGIEKNYMQGILSKVNDDKLSGKSIDGKPFNYKELTPEGWTINDNIWARYFNLNVANVNFGINPNNIILENGKSVFETYGIDRTGAFIDDQVNNEIKKASTFNKKKLPTNIPSQVTEEESFSKSPKFSNNEVLNNMSLFDEFNNEQEKIENEGLDLDKDFNDIIEKKTGIGADKKYSRVKAEVVGASKGRWNFFIPPSAEDFVGLLYKTLSKGKLGDSQMAWYKAHLLNPFARAMDNLSRDRVALMNDYKALKKGLKVVPKNLRKKIPGEGFTNEQAIRAYIWDKQGMNIPGLSQTDLKELTTYIENNENFKSFAEELISLQKGDQYAAPQEGWLAGTITTDLINGINTVKRSKYLTQWQTNVDQIFSEANLNKLEAAYGKGYRVALEDMLKRMRTGRNRNFKSDTLTGRVTDWLTNSIGAIMFFNTRSAVLQTISAVNFVNFKDNNIFAAGKAFANQPQFWSDFKTLFNSDFLVERRDGLRLNVNEADIADMAKKGGVRGVISGLLRTGFLPTQIADSFAIASGGSTFYRNRIKSLQKEGLSKADAETKAFQDFREIAEESQQSSRPDRISQQQAGPLGRVILAFANTPAQYARLMKKAMSDLKNGRGDTMTNVSKIFYYGVAQNIIFNALQQALFGLAFDDEEEDEKKQARYVNVANGMADSILRGMGVQGAIFSVLKNTALKLTRESEKKQPKYQDVLVKEIAQISPPVSSKLSKLKQAGRTASWDKKAIMTKGWSIDNPAYLAMGQVIAATTNIPLDRVFKKIDNIRNSSNSDLETWQRIASFAGWSDWELGIKETKKVKKPKKTSYKRNYKKQYKKRKYK